MKNVAILGSGAVGDALANGFLKYGYAVMRATRDPSKLQAWKAGASGEASVGTYEQAATWGDIIVLAVKGLVAEDVLDQAGIANLAGKVVIDTTNPIGAEPPEGGVIRYFTGGNDSLMERLQRRAPGARFVKAFNSVGNALMVNPNLESTPTMFICGNDTSAKKEVSKILDQFGHDVADMGTVEAARAIEPLCILWCIPGFLNNSWTHALRLMK